MRGEKKRGEGLKCQHKILKTPEAEKICAHKSWGEMKMDGLAKVTRKQTDGTKSSAWDNVEKVGKH